MPRTNDKMTYEELEKRARVLAGSSGLSQPYDGAIYSEGGDLLRGLLGEIDRLREALTQQGLGSDEIEELMDRATEKLGFEFNPTELTLEDLAIVAARSQVELRKRRGGDDDGKHYAADDPRAVEEDVVNNPSHYGGKDNFYEVIKVMLAWYGAEAVAWHCRMCALKYVARAGKKRDVDDNAMVAMVRDLRKAVWYTEAAANLLEHGTVREPTPGLTFEPSLNPSRR